MPLVYHIHICSGNKNRSNPSFRCTSDCNDEAVLVPSHIGLGLHKRALRLPVPRLDAGGWSFK